MKAIPQDVSESVRRRNPHLYNQGPVATQAITQGATPQKPPQLVKQKQGPKMNKTEAEFLAYWQAGNRMEDPRATMRNHAVTFVLANGVRYTPDFFDIHKGVIYCYEVKGRYVWDDAKVKIKVAASVWPEIRWIVAWKVKGVWQLQQMEP